MGQLVDMKMKREQEVLKSVIYTLFCDFVFLGHFWGFGRSSWGSQNAKNFNINYSFDTSQEMLKKFLC